MLLIQLTYSKYISKLDGIIYSDVATWSFKINGNTEKIQKINICDTIINGSKTKNKIAPGTEGEIRFEIDASGTDVDLEYKFKFNNIGTKPKNLKFIYNNIKYSDLEELQENIKGTIMADDKEKIRAIMINWIWQYESGDTEENIFNSDVDDTNDGLALEQYSINLIVNANQIIS